MKVMRGTLRRRARADRENGQSLLEAAVAVPLLLAIAFNIINFGYFWFMVLALSAAPRQGVQYATQGGAALTTTSGLPTADNICNLVGDNIGNAVLHSSTLTCAADTNVQIRVCSNAVGTPTAGVPKCKSYGPALVSLSAPAADPEPTMFALQRVDVVYQVTPVIPGGVFNIVVPANLKFHRQVSMRNLY